MQKLNIQVLKMTKTTDRMTECKGWIFGCWKIGTLRENRIFRYLALNFKFHLL